MAERKLTGIDEGRYHWADYYPFVEVEYELITDPKKWNTAEELRAFMDDLTPWVNDDPYYCEWIKDAWSGSVLSCKINPKSNTLWKSKLLRHRDGSGVRYFLKLYLCWDDRRGDVEEYIERVLQPTVNRIDDKLDAAGIWFGHTFWLTRKLENLDLRPSGHSS